MIPLSKLIGSSRRHWLVIVAYLHGVGLEMREIKQKAVIGGDEASLTVYEGKEEKVLGNDIMGFTIWSLSNCYRWEGPAIEICQ